jgi:cytosine/adenosine deaminase-related metal-dependent hydrolase
MAEVVRLAGARVALDAARTGRFDLTIAGGRVLPFDSSASPSTELDLSGYLLLPGLINAHDHLEFNLFPRLGNGPYPNATAWAADIYHPERSPIREHLLVPRPERLVWGGVKNLLSGVTTVAQHNPYDAAAFNARFPVRVVKRYGWAHSLAFSADIKSCVDRTPRKWPFVIHAAEGTDDAARDEIRRLREAGILDRRTVLVHAVGAGAAELEMIRERGASIVWCPSSNLFTLGRTLRHAAVRYGLRIALGTDSALTAAGDIIDEMRATGLSAEEVYPLVTTQAAAVLRLSAGEGTISAGGVADLIAVRDTGQTPARSIMESPPELVMVRGRIMLLSDGFAGHRGFHRIQLEGRASRRIRADIPRLIASAARAIGPEVRLAGRRVCV